MRGAIVATLLATANFALCVNWAQAAFWHSWLGKRAVWWLLGCLFGSGLVCGLASYWATLMITGTNSGKTAQGVIAGSSVAIVSRFYAGRPAVDSPQGKTLVHLMYVRLDELLTERLCWAEISAKVGNLSRDDLVLEVGVTLADSQKGALSRANVNTAVSELSDPNPDTAGKARGLLIGYVSAKWKNLRRMNY